MSLCIDLHVHSTWADRCCLGIAVCHIIVIGDHAALILITNWCGDEIKVALRGSSARRTWWQVLSMVQMNRRLVLEVELSGTYWYIIRTLSHIPSCGVVWSICLEVFESDFFRLYALRVLRLYCIGILWTTKSSLSLFCAVLLRWVGWGICRSLRYYQGGFRTALVHYSIKRSDLVILQYYLLWQLKVVIWYVLNVVYLGWLL